MMRTVFDGKDWAYAAGASQGADNSAAPCANTVRRLSIFDPPEVLLRPI
jgi:hypothetical protein